MKSMRKLRLFRSLSTRVSRTILVNSTAERRSQNELVPLRIDSCAGLGSKSLAELFRAAAVFTACRIRPLVSRSEMIVGGSYAILGSRITNFFLRQTFFGQFCAGENEESIRPVINKLSTSGVGTILDYSAESDTASSGKVNPGDFSSVVNNHVHTFLRCLATARSVCPSGFIAVKLTAISDPILLEKVSELLRKESLTNRPRSYEGFRKLTGSANLSTKDIAAFESIYQNAHQLAREAVSLGIGMHIDAEQSYLQPAVDLIIQDLMAHYNKQKPVVFGTHQMYLRDSHERLTADIQTARDNDYHFATKLVRGAYMVHERARAKERGEADPILPSAEATHKNYDDNVKMMLEHVARGAKVHVMVATHNHHSVDLAVKAMNELKLPPTSSVFFAQLLGMRDDITHSLGNAGYRAFKYVPYGKVEEVMPYLIRRAQENADALGGASDDLNNVIDEIKRRALTVTALRMKRT